MNTQNDYYIQVLNYAFERKKLKNTQFSLRAFARDLDINSGTLSRILRGERIPSMTLGQQIAMALKLNLKERELFLNSLAQKKWQQEPERVAQDLKNYKEAKNNDQKQPVDAYHIELEKFRFLSDWIHYALMELTYVSGFQDDTKWMSQQLGRNEDDVQDALDRLLYLGLLVRNEGKLIKSNTRVTTKDKTQTNKYLKKMQKDLLIQATKSLDEVDISKRIASSMTMAINPVHIQKARSLFSHFLSDMCGLLEDGEQTEVYHLLINLSPANTKTKDNNENTTH